jgi:phosphomannomutase/phosphoglucomutase
MKNIFREYDIRGIVEKELNEQTCKLIGYFLGQEIKKIDDFVVVGYDARLHSEEIFGYLTSGLNASGVRVLNAQMVPTPVVYFCNYSSFGEMKSTSSIMITGSHNPKNYNGFKITINQKPFFGDNIYRLGKKIEQNIDMIIKDDENCTKIDAKEKYIDYMINQFSHLKNLKTSIVLDAGNGTAGIVLKDIFDKLNMNYKALYFEPDGNFPNHHPDPSEEKNLVDLKKELFANRDIAFGYDGDSDRIAVLTKNNNIKGDILAILLAKAIQNPIVIGEVKCSNIMYQEINKIGKAIMYKTGHSNLKVKIKEENAHLAAEVSGHIFFADRYFGFDDAIYTTLRVLELINDGIDLDGDIKKLPIIFSTNEQKYETTEDKKFLIIDEIKNIIEAKKDSLNIKNLILIDGVRIVFEDGWVLIRASNTTPVLVIRVESTIESNIEKYQDFVNIIIEKAEKNI